MKSNQNSLASLQKKWYKKLAAKGFKDIEDDKGRLKTYIASTSLHIEDHGPIPPVHRSIPYSSKLWKESQAEYYRVAGQSMFSKDFAGLESSFRRIWALHADGKTVTEIAKLMKMPRTNVQSRICKMRMIFFKSEQ